MNTFLVGGAVRDQLMGLKPKDLDFAVEAESYEEMRQGLLDQGFRIWLESPLYFTLRCAIPSGHWGREYGKDADFVLCRRDGVYTDGRRPDSVGVGTILEDLKRRDFTMNAMAIGEDGALLDPHGGKGDLESKLIRFVGNPTERIFEDGLRVLRALRFSVTKDMKFAGSTRSALESDDAARCLARVADERIYEELKKMFVKTRTSLSLLNEFPRIRRVCFQGRVRLMPTMEVI